MKRCMPLHIFRRKEAGKEKHDMTTFPDILYRHFCFTLNQ